MYRLEFYVVAGWLWKDDGCPFGDEDAETQVRRQCVCAYTRCCLHVNWRRQGGGGHISGRKAVLHVTNLVPRAWLCTLLAFGWFGCLFVPFRCGCCGVIIRLDALHPCMVTLAFVQGKSAPPIVFCIPFPTGVSSLPVHAVLLALHRCPYEPRTDRHLQRHVFICIGIHCVRPIPSGSVS